MVSKALTRPDRVYAVGDVHGHVDRLRALHARIRTDLATAPVRSALLVHLGDYIDRGPDSAACLAELANGDPIDGVPTANLMGNHERMLLDALDDRDAAVHWWRNGGDATLASWGISRETPPERWREMIPPKQLDWLSHLLPYYINTPFLFVHAGVRPGVPLAQQTEEDLLWIRRPFLQWEGPMLPDAPDLLIVHGHTPGPQPELRRNRLGVDTNAGRGGPLTCAVLGPDSVYFLQA